MKITLAKGGTDQKTVELDTIQVPDLWSIAQLPQLQGFTIGDKPAKTAVLECWRLCHALLNKLREIDKKVSKSKKE